MAGLQDYAFIQAETKRAEAAGISVELVRRSHSILLLYDRKDHGFGFGTGLGSGSGRPGRISPVPEPT